MTDERTPLSRDRPIPSPPGQRRVYRRRRVAAVIAGVAVLGLVGTAFGVIFRLQANVTTSPLRASEIVPDDEVEQKDLNILLLGSDGRGLSSDAYGEDDGSKRSDAMVLAHLSADNTRIDAVQLPRDTLVDLPACGDTGRGSFAGGRGMLNSALNYGAACSVSAVEQLTDVHIDHFIEMDFEGFIGIVDAMGGVDVCLPESLHDPHANLNLDAGPQTVDGSDALALARTRHALHEESDIARLNHQQMVMSAIVQSATKSDVLKQPDRLYAFLDAVTASMTVDPQLGALTDLASLALRVANVSPSAVTFITMPWAIAPSDPNRVVSTVDADVVFEHLANDTAISLVSEDDDTETSDERVRTAVVAVLNAAAVEGLASRTSQDATARGYNVVDTSNASDTSAHSSLVTDGSEEALNTAMSLAAELGLRLSPEIGDVDGVQLTLGTDYDSIAIDSAEATEPVEATSRSADVDLCAE